MVKPAYRFHAEKCLLGLEVRGSKKMEARRGTLVIGLLAEISRQALFAARIVHKSSDSRAA
jgi:hypothetical protein